MKDDFLCFTSSLKQPINLVSSKFSGSSFSSKIKPVQKLCFNTSTAEAKNIIQAGWNDNKED